MNIPVDRIHANRLNPRKDLGDISDLVPSIRDHGLLEQIVLTPCTCDEQPGSHFRILDGHRRFRALLALNRVALSEAEYDLREVLTKQQEVALVVERNLRRKQYSPAEAYEALELERRYGMLKEMSRVAGMNYNSMKKFSWTMKHLIPQLRDRVVWRRDPNADIAAITIREARELAQLSPDRQLQLAGKTPYLSRAQLAAAVTLIKEGGVTSVEDAVKKATTQEPDARMEDKVAAAYLAAFISIRKKVEPRDLVSLGFSHSTAKRTIKALEQARVLTTGSPSPLLLRKLRDMAETDIKQAENFLRMFFGERK
jgi:ParB-like chromosome segregation protein Spo0J